MSEEIIPDKEVDARRLLCPLPIIRAEAAIKTMEAGQILGIRATDKGIHNDLPAWCAVNHHQFLGIREEPGGVFLGLVRRQS